MIAAPIIPGLLYRVRGRGRCLALTAGNAAEAIVKFAERLPCPA